MLDKFRAWYAKHKKRNTIVVILLVLGGLFLPGQITALIQGPQAQYETTQAKKRDLTSVIDASGMVMAHEEAVIQFQASGKLNWVGVKKGDTVRKWQAIASLDRQSLQQALKKELIDYQNERWNFEQDHDTYDSTGLPIEKTVTDDAIKRILEKAQFDLDRTVIDYELAKLSYDLAVIYTPIAGIVTDVESPLPGVNITPATAQFTVTNPDSVYFEVKVDEADIGQLKEGLPVEVTLDAYPDEILEGVVEKIHFASVTTRGGGTAFPVEIGLPENIDLKFKSGMNGDAEIILEQKKDVLSLPYRSVKNGSGTRVKIIENRQVIERDVETGMETDSWIEIISGLSETDLVIISEKSKK